MFRVSWILLIKLFVYAFADLEYSDDYDENSSCSMTRSKDDKVTIEVYYGTMCPYSRQVYTNNLVPLVKDLGEHLVVKTYPYGIVYNAVQQACQHGPEECYGNKLHACTLYVQGKNYKALEFNGCLMSYDRKNQGSDDKAVDECSKKLEINPVPIKKCAKGKLGYKLFNLFGKKSTKANFDYVPYILINGMPSQSYGEKLRQEVCKAFTKKPSGCLKKEKLLQQ